MRTSPILVGILFGVVLAGALAAPLFVSLPARFLDDWWYVQPQLAMAMLVCALVVPVAAGFSGAMLAGEGEAVRGGTTAGTLAALIGGVAVAVPASAVHAFGELLATVDGGRAAAGAMRDAAASALVSGAWLPSATAVAFLALGPALGAIGGVGYDLWEGALSRKSQQIHRSSVPLAGLYALTLSVGASAFWTAHLDVTMLRALGHPPTWVDRVLLSTPVLAGGVATSALVAWALRDAVILARSGSRFFGLCWGSMALGAPSLMAIEVAGLHPQLLLSPFPWLAGFTVAVTALVTIIVTRRGDAELHELPRGFVELLAEGLLMGVVVISMLTFVGGGPVAAAVALGVPYLRALLGGVAEVTLQPETAVLRLFVGHWTAAALIVPLAVTYSIFAVPVWLVVRAVIARDRRDPDPIRRVSQASGRSSVDVTDPGSRRGRSEPAPPARSPRSDGLRPGGRTTDPGPDRRSSAGAPDRASPGSDGLRPSRGSDGLRTGGRTTDPGPDRRSSAGAPDRASPGSDGLRPSKSKDSGPRTDPGGRPLGRDRPSRPPR